MNSTNELTQNPGRIHSAAMVANRMNFLKSMVLHQAKILHLD